MKFIHWWLLLGSFANFSINFYDSKPIVEGIAVYTSPGNEPKYPFMVSLQDVRENGGTTHFCGGSLLNLRWILTAAHCLWRKDLSKVVAFIGHYDLTDHKAKSDNYRLSHVEYSSFQPASFRNDIALVRLEREYVGSTHSIKFAQMPESWMMPNRKRPCSIIGYGALSHIGVTSTRLMEATVYVITNRECRKKLGHVWAPKKGDNTVCAVGEHQDACQGDSGGPLICRYQDQDYVFGIVSHGIACGDRGVPSVYTVTVPFVNWIGKIIGN